MNKIVAAGALLVMITFNLCAQVKMDSVEVFIINSFVDKETNKFSLSFSTDLDYKSKVIIEDKYSYIVSDSAVQNHSVEIDLANLKFKSNAVNYRIIVTDSTGKSFDSGIFEFDLPQDVVLQDRSNILHICLFAGVVFAVPAPAVTFTHDKTYFTLTKEIPIAFIRSTGIDYPFGYFSAEYSHIFERAKKNNLLRFGYKHLIDLPGLEFASPGISGFTNFKGYNGVGAEFTVGFFKCFEAFTLYGRYRFNFSPSVKASETNEISIGLYSGFFAFYF
ncbi:MAG: hypothetical protein Q8903_14800 [Bacteroidota bacterium]|nr:hypothetical protein [Bacteroidota bacterium]